MCWSQRPSWRFGSPPRSSGKTPKLLAETTKFVARHASPQRCCPLRHGWHASLRHSESKAAFRAGRQPLEPSADRGNRSHRHTLQSRALALPEPIRRTASRCARRPHSRDLADRSEWQAAAKPGIQVLNPARHGRMPDLLRPSQRLAEAVLPNQRLQGLNLLGRRGQLISFRGGLGHAIASPALQDRHSARQRPPDPARQAETLERKTRAVEGTRPPASPGSSRRWRNRSSAEPRYDPAPIPCAPRGPRKYEPGPDSRSRDRGRRPDRGRRALPRESARSSGRSRRARQPTARRH